MIDWNKHQSRKVLKYANLREFSTNQIEPNTIYTQICNCISVLQNYLFIWSMASPQCLETWQPGHHQWWTFQATFDYRCRRTADVHHIGSMTIYSWEFRHPIGDSVVQISWWKTVLSPLYSLNSQLEFWCWTSPIFYSAWWFQTFLK